MAMRFVATAAALAAVVAYACGAAPGGEAPAPASAAAIVKAFFAEPDARRRGDLAAQFAAVAPKSWAEVRAMLHACSGRPALAAGKHRFQTPGDADVPPVSYILRVPAGYRCDRPQGWPVVICGHGTGGTGDAAMTFIEGVLGEEVEQYLVACPTSPQGGVYVAERLVIEYPLRVLEDVRRRANVDSDRTVLTGYSRGGYTAWGTVLFSPGEWAGAVPAASWPLTEGGSAAAIFYLPNVLNVAIQAHWGENDIEPGQTEGINTLSRQTAAELKRLGAAKFEGIEYAGQGHGLKLQNDRIRAFIAAARREAFPAEGRLIFHRLYQGRAWAVRATAAAKEEFDFRQRRVLRIARKEDLDRAKRDLWLKEGYELVVRMPPGQNLLAVNARNLSEVEIELPAERLDFSRPIRVTVNGRSVLEGRRPVDYGELLETARRTGDFERLIAGRLKVQVAR